MIEMDEERGFRASLFHSWKSEIIPLGDYSARNKKKRVRSCWITITYTCLLAPHSKSTCHAPCVMVILKITPSWLREINRTPGQTSVLSTRLIVRRVFSHQRVHIFFFFSSLRLFHYVFFFSHPLWFTAEPSPDLHFSNSSTSPLFNICIPMHARSSSIVSLSFNDIVPRVGSLLGFVIGSQLAKAKNLQGYFRQIFSILLFSLPLFPLVVSSRRCFVDRPPAEISIFFFLLFGWRVIFGTTITRGAKFLRVMQSDWRKVWWIKDRQVEIFFHRNR